MKTDYVVSIIADYYDRVSVPLERFTDHSFSRDVYGLPMDYNKSLSIHYIGFVLFLLAQEISISNYDRDYSEYHLRMVRNYLQCLGIRHEVTNIIIEAGIGKMIIQQTFKIH